MRLIEKKWIAQIMQLVSNRVRIWTHFSLTPTSLKTNILRYWKVFQKMENSSWTNIMTYKRGIRCDFWVVPISFVSQVEIYILFLISADVIDMVWYAWMITKVAERKKVNMTLSELGKQSINWGSSPLLEVWNHSIIFQ